MLQDKVIR